MLNLYFGNVYSAITLALVAGMAVFIALTIKNQSRIVKWGRWIALFIVAGTAISAVSAMRDGYASGSAVFAMDSMQSTVCSIAGGLIFLTGIVCIFMKNQTARKFCFFGIAALFAVQVLTIEASRPFLVL